MLAVPNGAVPDTESSRRLERGGRKRDDLAVLLEEELAALRVDQRHRVGRARGEHGERRDARGGNVERERERASRGKPHADSREAARADTDGERVEVARLDACVSQQRVDVLEYAQGRRRRPLTEHLALSNERARRDRRRGVKREDQHSRW
jgi:hypothetical protein